MSSARLQGELGREDKSAVMYPARRKGFSVQQGRFPVTLYKEQWLRILASAREIKAFIRENESKFEDEGVGL